MKKTGQDPMEVNAMTDVLMLNESDKEQSYGDVNAMQYGEHCFLCKKTGHLKRNFREFEEWRRNNLNWKNRSTNRLEIPTVGQFSCYNCGKNRNMLQDCKVERLNNGGKGNRNQGGGQAAEIAKFQTDVMEVIKKGVSDVMEVIKKGVSDVMEVIKKGVSNVVFP